MNPRSMSVSLGPKPPRGEDIPLDPGEPMESSRHLHQIIVLIESLNDAWRGRDDFFVGGDMPIYFSETQARNKDFRAPDVFVVLDTERRERKRWIVWEEDGRTPDVVIELVSDSTEQIDRGRKMIVYARMLHVPVYVVYDPFSARLDGFQLDPARRRFTPIEPDARGWIRCEPLGLWLGILRGVRREIDAPWLRWFDDDGNVLPEPSEKARDAEVEIARLRAELAKSRG